jgi:hypothetical protein
MVHGLAPAAKGFGELGIVRPRRDRGGQFTATAARAVPIGIVVLQTALLGGIAVVVEDHGQNRQATFLAQTKAGDHGVVVKAAIPDRGHYQAVRHGKLHPQGIGQSLAQATKAPHVAPCPWTLQISIEHLAVHDELVDDHRIRRDRLVECIAQPSWVNRAGIPGGQRFFACCVP